PSWPRDWSSDVCSSDLRVALLTVCPTAELVLPENPGAVVVPPYTAVRLCEPAANDGEHVAVLVPLSEVVQSVVAPSLNVTVPLRSEERRVGNAGSVRGW